MKTMAGVLFAGMLVTGSAVAGQIGDVLDSVCTEHANPAKCKKIMESVVGISYKSGEITGACVQAKALSKDEAYKAGMCDGASDATTQEIESIAYPR